MDIVIAHLKGQLHIAARALLDIQKAPAHGARLSAVITIADRAITDLIKNPEPQLWMPIATAPLDHMVLTDRGCAIYQTDRDLAFWTCRAGWFTCSPEGDIFEDADCGISPSRTEPTLWMEFPALPTKEG